MVERSHVSDVSSFGFTGLIILSHKVSVWNERW